MRRSRGLCRRYRYRAEQAGNGEERGSEPFSLSSAKHPERVTQYVELWTLTPFSTKMNQGSMEEGSIILRAGILLECGNKMIVSPFANNPFANKTNGTNKVQIV